MANRVKRRMERIIDHPDLLAYLKKEHNLVEFKEKDSDAWMDEACKEPAFIEKVKNENGLVEKKKVLEIIVNNAKQEDSEAPRRKVEKIIRGIEAI